MTLEKILKEIQDSLREKIAKRIINNEVDLYQELPYDEEKQKSVINISLNSEDSRILKITLIIKPDQ